MRMLLTLTLYCWAQAKLSPTDVARAVAPTFPGPCVATSPGSVECGCGKSTLRLTWQEPGEQDVADLITVRRKITAELAAMSRREAKENPHPKAQAVAMLARLGREDKTPGGRLVFYTLMPTAESGAEMTVLLIDRPSGKVLTMTRIMAAPRGGVADEGVFDSLAAAAGRLERVVWR